MISQVHELTGFQRDLMVHIGETGDKPSGSELHSMMSESYDKDVTPPRVYNNLNALVESGFVQKGEIDRRTNYYQLSSEGREALESYREFVGE